MFFVRQLLWCQNARSNLDLGHFIMLFSSACFMSFYYRRFIIAWKSSFTLLPYSKKSLCKEEARKTSRREWKRRGTKRSPLILPHLSLYYPTFSWEHRNKEDSRERNESWTIVLESSILSLFLEASMTRPAIEIAIEAIMQHGIFFLLN